MSKQSLIPNSNSTRISSRDIAQWCEKQHAHVIRDIEKMLDDLKLRQSKFGSSYLNRQNKPQKEYLLPKDLVLTLITGYRTDLRYAVIKRVEELEAGAKPAKVRRLSPQQSTALGAAVRAKFPEAQRREVYDHLKTYFGVYRYKGIPSVQFDEAMKLIEQIPLKALPAPEPKEIEACEQFLQISETFAAFHGELRNMEAALKQAQENLSRATDKMVDAEILTSNHVETFSDFYGRVRTRRKAEAPAGVPRKRSQSATAVKEKAGGMK